MYIWMHFGSLSENYIYFLNVFIYLCLFVCVFIYFHFYLFIYIYLSRHIYVYLSTILGEMNETSISLVIVGFYY